MYSQSGAEEPVFWTFKELIIFFLWHHKVIVLNKL